MMTWETFEDECDPPNIWEYVEINREIYASLETEDPETENGLKVSEMCNLMMACGDVLGVNYYE
jgi:hypothetical protein